MRTTVGNFEPAYRWNSNDRSWLAGCNLRPAMRLLFCALVAGCASAPPSGPIARSLSDAAAEANVPADVVTAVAVEEQGLALPALRIVDTDDNVPIAGRLELRHGKLDTLALGASLVGANEDAIIADTELGTRAGALVLARLGATADSATWRTALEQLSGLDDAGAHDYASRVLAILRTGGEFAARGGERVHVGAHPELAVETARVTPAATPDYPGAIWFQTSCTNKCTVGRPLGMTSVDKIVIHDTEGGWDASVATLQNDSGKSVHYIIDADGSRVGQFRPETDTTWHAGNYYFNETSIGIEHVGYASDTYDKALYAASVDLVQSIRSRWSVPLDRLHIIGHYQIPDGGSISETSDACSDTLDACETSPNYGGADHHRDPGYNWQWCEYMEQLGGSCTCNDAWSHFNCTTDGTEAWRCNNGTLEEQVCSGAAGCSVQPIGTDDICDTGGTGSGSGSGSGSAMQPVAKADSGCTTGGGASALVAFALLALRRRRR
jgi:N-acetyl-anhydromuramyl-L-alanine amidase AmpD